MSRPPSSPAPRILMPTDGSPCSEAAVRRGLRFAAALGAEVTFLYAVEDPLTPQGTSPYDLAYRTDLYDDPKEAAREALGRAASMAEEAGVPCRTVLVEREHPVRAIRAAERDADLVIMGTHGRRGFNRLLFGSVAEEALHGAHKPYLILRHEGGTNREGVPFESA